MKKIISVVLCVLLMCGCMVGCGAASDDDVASNVSKTESKDSVDTALNGKSKYNIDVTANDNIDVKTSLSYDGYELIVCLKNNNSYDIGSIDIIATYYDKNGNKLGEDDSMALNFKSGSEFATSLFLPYNNDYECIIPDKIELTIAVDEEYQEQALLPHMYDDKIEVSHNKEDEKILVTVTNNSGVNIDTFECAILFIKNDEAIAIDSFYGSLEVNKSDSLEVDIPIDWEKSEYEDVLIEYDSIKIVINEASQYE